MATWIEEGDSPTIEGKLFTCDICSTKASFLHLILGQRVCHWCHSNGLLWAAKQAHKVHKEQQEALSRILQQVTAKAAGQFHPLPSNPECVNEKVNKTAKMTPPDPDPQLEVKKNPFYRE